MALRDSDIQRRPQNLAKQMARLVISGTNVVGCFCGMVTIRDRADLPGELLASAGARIAVDYVPDPGYQRVQGDIRVALLHASLVSTQMLVAQREALMQIGGFDESLPALEDWECAIRLAELGHFAFVNEPLALQFFSDNSLTRSRRKRADARERIIEKHQALFADHPAILARQFVSIAGDFRWLGDIAKARAALGNALRVRPFDPKTLAKWILLALWPASWRPPT